MNSPSEIPSDRIPAAPKPSGAGDFEATLRLIASLPAPTGLEDRVLAKVLAAPRSGRVLDWPRPLAARAAARTWMRGAAAAAIVLVVGGGGWSIYSHVQPDEPAHVLVMLPRVVQHGGFSSAGVIRSPQTIPGPVVKPAAKAHATEAKPAGKPHAHSAATAAPAAR